MAAVNPMPVLRADFQTLNARDKHLERRRMFHALLLHFHGLNARRPDLKAMVHLQTIGASFDDISIGDVPGVDVGERFDYRAEMRVVGLHRDLVAGIECEEFTDATGRVTKVACSVVESKAHEANVPGDDDFVLGDHGRNGDPRTGLAGDQIFRSEITGLCRSVDENTPIRVIRGRRHPRNRRDIILGHNARPAKYWYSGLFRAVSHTYEPAGDIYRFRLVRIQAPP